VQNPSFDSESVMPTSPIKLSHSYRYLWSKHDSGRGRPQIRIGPTLIPAATLKPNQLPLTLGIKQPRLIISQGHSNSEVNSQEHENHLASLRELAEAPASVPLEPLIAATSPLHNFCILCRTLLGKCSDGSFATLS